MEPADRPPRVLDDDLADALPAALERASLLEWRLEQVTLREKDLWLRLEAERSTVADAQQRIVDLTARVHEVEDQLAEALRTNASMTARLAESDRPDAAEPRPERDAAALARAWRRAHRRAEHYEASLTEARARLEVLEHAQVRFHTRLTQWQRQVATARHDLDLAEFIAELRGEVLRLGQVNAELRRQLGTQSDDDDASDPSTPPVSSIPPLASSVPPPAASSLPPPMASSTPVAASGGRAGEPEPPLSEDLWSADPAVRRRSAAALSARATPQARESLLTALTMTTDVNELVFFLGRLAEAGGIAGDDVLATYVGHDDPVVRAAALDAVRSTAIVVEATADLDPYVRRRALIRWTQLNPAEARAGLTRAIHDDNAGVRRTACAALAGHPEAASIAALLTAADDPDPGVRSAAVRALPVALRQRLSDAVHGDAVQRRTTLNAIRAERRAHGARGTSPNAR